MYTTSIKRWMPLYLGLGLEWWLLHKHWRHFWGENWSRHCWLWRWKTAHPTTACVRCNTRSSICWFSCCHPCSHSVGIGSSPERLQLRRSCGGNGDWLGDTTGASQGRIGRWSGGEEGGASVGQTRLTGKRLDGKCIIGLHPHQRWFWTNSVHINNHCHSEKHRVAQWHALWCTADREIFAVKIFSPVA